MWYEKCVCLNLFFSFFFRMWSLWFTSKYKHVAREIQTYFLLVWCICQCRLMDANYREQLVERFLILVKRGERGTRAYISLYCVRVSYVSNNKLCGSLYVALHITFIFLLFPLFTLPFSLSLSPSLFLSLSFALTYTQALTHTHSLLCRCTCSSFSHTHSNISVYGYTHVHIVSACVWVLLSLLCV